MSCERAGAGQVMPHYIFEARAAKTIAGPIAGVDEAGRGPLAGPVIAAAVILDRKRIPKGLNDSKQMTAEAREEAYREDHGVRDRRRRRCDRG